MDPLPRQPRTISEYYLAFRTALEKEFNAEDPGRSEQFYLVADHIGTKNKRQLILYISHAAPETATKYTRVSYKLPVSAEASPLFGGEGDEIIPSEGPTFETHTINPGSLMTAIAAHNREEAPWATEIQRVRGVRDGAEEGSKMRRAANNVLKFWAESRDHVFDEVYYISIRIRRTLSGRSASSSTPRRTTSRRITSRNGKPRSLKVSSYKPWSARATARASSSYQRSRTSSAKRKPNSDPSVARLPRDPVTGKIIRRRRPNSDPKDEE